MGSIAELDGETNPSCTFKVDEAYGGGRNADQDGWAKLLLTCIEGMGTVYGGAENADVERVNLNITNGTYDRVFGGNNKGGRVNGSITVNIEETGCRPVIIGELYGGGNMAAYSIYGYTAAGTDDDGNTIWNANESKVANGPEYTSPEVNVKSFTSIGNIYGGGYGPTATMVGNPTVNINEAVDLQSNGQAHTDANHTEDTITIDEGLDTEHDVTRPSHKAGEMGAINNVFGGGNAAPVIGNTNVNIGTKKFVDMVSVTEGSDVSRYYTRSGAGSQADPYVYTPVAPVVVAVANTTYYKLVFNNGAKTYLQVPEADITVGDTDVSKYFTCSGAGSQADPYVYTPVTSRISADANTTYYMPVVGADIRGNVYGGGNAANVTGNTNVVIGKEDQTNP